MRRIIAITMMGASVLGLTACHTTGNNTPNGVSKTAASDSTQTYALPGQQNYRGNEQAFYKNPMRAPANQVYYFAFDSSKMRPEDVNALRIQANYLMTHRNARIRLEGNTDNRGSREYNIGLGWRRDQSVGRLLEQWGVRPRQIKMVSYGKEHPVVPENNEHAWALNRRVNLIYEG